MVKQNNNTWYIIGGVVIVILLVIILWRVFTPSSSSTEKVNIPFSSQCKFDLTGGQFGGTQGDNSITCTFRNDGQQTGEGCFNVQEIKTDGAVETILATYKICSGSLSPGYTSDAKKINEPQTYKVFSSTGCSLMGQNSGSWTCTMDNNREIKYTIKVTELN